MINDRKDEPKKLRDVVDTSCDDIPDEDYERRASCKGCPAYPKAHRGRRA